MSRSCPVTRRARAKPPEGRVGTVGSRRIVDCGAYFSWLERLPVTQEAAHNGTLGQVILAFVAGRPKLGRTSQHKARFSLPIW